MPELIKLKRKYRVEKPVGRYKGGHNDSRRRRPPKKKLNAGKRQTEQSKAIMVMLPSGKIKMERTDGQ